MRIVGGEYRGRALANLGKGDEKGRLRPTSDRVRESLFNVLEHGNYPSIENARVLDLFAGTGALGLEAISRGAECAVFVEKGKVGQSIIRKNIDLLQCSNRVSLLPKDVLKLGQNPGEPYDLCFIDPPYGKGLGTRAIELAVRGNWLSDQVLIVLEEGALIEPPSGFMLSDVRPYGDTHIHMIVLN